MVAGTGVLMLGVVAVAACDADNLAAQRETIADLDGVV
jgi:hypothetical protein